MNPSDSFQNLIAGYLRSSAPSAQVQVPAASQVMLGMLSAQKVSSPPVLQETLVSANLQTLLQTRACTNIGGANDTLLPSVGFPSLASSRHPQQHPSRQAPQTKRLRLLILVRLLLKELSRPEDLALKMLVKDMVRECNRRHQNGDPRCGSLPEAVEGVLQGAVGETRWRRVTQKLDIMMLQRRQRLMGRKNGPGL